MAVALSNFTTESEDRVMCWTVGYSYHRTFLSEFCVMSIKLDVSFYFIFLTTGSLIIYHCPMRPTKIKY